MCHLCLLSVGVKCEGTCEHGMCGHGEPLPLLNPSSVSCFLWRACQAFGGVCNLVAVAEEVQKFTAICHGCAGDAAFSKRITADTDVEVRLPLCRRLRMLQSPVMDVVALDVAGVDAKLFMLWLVLLFGGRELGEGVGVGGGGVKARS